MNLGVNTEGQTIHPRVAFDPFHIARLFLELICAAVYALSSANVRKSSFSVPSLILKVHRQQREYSVLIRNRAQGAEKGHADLSATHKTQ